MKLDQPSWRLRFAGTVQFAGTLDISAAAYQGPGDVASGALAWWGLRAFSNAQCTGSVAAVDLVDQAGANTTTINILTNGALDVAAITAWVAAHTVTTIKVTKVYDQVGTNHLQQPTLANMPSLNLTATGGTKPAVSFNGTSSYLTSTSTIAQSQPFTTSAFLNPIDGNSLEQKVIASNSNTLFFETDNGQPAGGPLAPVIFAGGANQGAYPTAINVFYGFQGIFNGASSDLNKNGTANTGTDIGPNGMSGTAYIGCMSSLTQFAYVHLCEIGMWPSAFATGTSASMNTNQHDYWGV